MLLLRSCLSRIFALSALSQMPAVSNRGRHPSDAGSGSWFAGPCWAGSRPFCDRITPVRLRQSQPSLPICTSRMTRLRQGGIQSFHSASDRGAKSCAPHCPGGTSGCRRAECPFPEAADKFPLPAVQSCRSTWQAWPSRRLCNLRAVFVLKLVHAAPHDLGGVQLADGCTAGFFRKLSMARVSG